MPNIVPLEGGSPYSGPGITGSEGGSSGTYGGSGDIYGALIGLGTMLWNNYQQRQMMEDQNEYNKQNALDKYNRDLDFWNMQNKYNSPAEMMKRFTNAGLSENLIYGGAAGGGASSGGVDAPLVQTGAPPGMMLGNLPQSILAFQDIQMKHAQIDNVKANTDLIKNNTLLSAMKYATGDIKRQYDEYAKDLFLDYGHAYAEQQLLLNAGKIGLQDTEKEIGQERIKQSRLETTRAGIENEKAEADLLFKQNENQWRSMGITSSDNVMLRVLVRALKYIK